MQPTDEMYRGQGTYASSLVFRPCASHPSLHGINLHRATAPLNAIPKTVSGDAAYENGNRRGDRTVNEVCKSRGNRSSVIALV